MVKLYVNKIVNREINSMTGLPWTIYDVPYKWRAQVREMLVNL